MSGGGGFGKSPWGWLTREKKNHDKAYLVVVDHIDDNRELSLVGAVANQRHAANFHKSLKALHGGGGGGGEEENAPEEVIALLQKKKFRRAGYRRGEIPHEFHGARGKRSAGTLHRHTPL